MTSPLELYSSGLDTVLGGGSPAGFRLRTSDGTLRPLDLDRWCAADAPGDAELLDACTGPVLDVGCGPGRLAAALAGRGVLSLGIDLSPSAVRHARAAGASALCRSVFDRVPGVGRWNTVLLADGNLGIGGDPVALLARCRDLLAPGGRVLAELEPTGGATGAVALHLERLHDDGAVETSPAFPWAFVDEQALASVARPAGLVVDRVWHAAGRPVAELVEAG